MKIAIFTGSINLQKENKDVRKLYITEKLKYFNSRDAKLEVVTPQINGYNLPLFNNIEYNMYKYTDRKHFTMLSSSVYSISKLIRLDCELIHCYNLQAGLLAWLVNYFRRQKYLIIFEPMGLAHEESKYSNPPLKIRLAGFFAKFPEKLVFKKSGAVIVYTHSLKEYITKKFNINAQKIYVIPHGTNLNTESATGKINKFSILNSLNIPQKNKVVMYGGMLSDLHGTQYLIEAISIINKNRQDISFLILGKGNLEEKISLFIKENKLTNVYLLGFVPPEEFGFYLKLADILLIPHAKCTQTELDPPTKLFEYLASGRPIVSFNLKAIAEVVGDNAILVEPDNPKALAEGILTLADNDGLRSRLGERGRSIVKEYSWEMSAKKQLDLYKELFKKYINK